MSEQLLQTNVIRYLNLKYPKIRYCASLGGIRTSIKQAIKAKATGFQLDQNILFLGPRDDIPDMLHLSDLAILCSHEEGFSNAILEGMAVGLPMVVTDVGGNAEAMQNGVTGIVVPAREPSALGAAILKLAKNAQLRKRMGREARKRVQQ